jgi:hypothetical protein
METARGNTAESARYRSLAPGCSRHPQHRASLANEAEGSQNGCRSDFDFNKPILRVQRKSIAASERFVLLSLAMDQTEDELKRALRTVKRSLETVETVTISPEEATKVLFSAVYQLLFLVEKLVDEQSRSRRL